MQIGSDEHYIQIMKRILNESPRSNEKGKVWQNDECLFTGDYIAGRALGQNVPKPVRNKFVQALLKKSNALRKSAMRDGITIIPIPTEAFEATPVTPEEADSQMTGWGRRTVGFAITTAINGNRFAAFSKKRIRIAEGIASSLHEDVKMLTTQGRLGPLPTAYLMGEAVEAVTGSVIVDCLATYVKKQRKLLAAGKDGAAASAKRVRIRALKTA